MEIHEPTNNHVSGGRLQLYLLATLGSYPWGPPFLLMAYQKNSQTLQQAIMLQI